MTQTITHTMTQTENIRKCTTDLFCKVVQKYEKNANCLALKYNDTHIHLHTMTNIHLPNMTPTTQNDTHLLTHTILHNCTYNRERKNQLL